MPQRLGRSFDWLRCYTPALQDWEKKGLLIERVDLGLGATDPISYRMQISYECPEAGKRIYGYGESTRELFAYEKAIAELVEREAMFLHGIQLGIKTTNGLAAHRFTFLAKQTAKIELQERDAFLRHWLTRTPLLKIPDPDDALVRAFRRAIEAEGYNLILASTYMGRIPSVIAIIHNRETGGFLIGSSAVPSLRARIRKAIAESFLSLHSQREPMPIVWDRPSFETHANYWFFHNSMPTWFVGNRTQDIGKVESPKFEFHLLRRKPIPVIAVRSPDLIDLWTGKTPASVIEQIRAAYNCTPNTCPHPFP